MMWQQGAWLCWVDVTFYMSISMLLLHGLHDDDVRWQQESLLLWLLLGEYGLIFSHTLHNEEGGLQQEALLRWLLLGEYGHHTWYDDGVVWQQDAFLWWLLLREYGSTFHMSTPISLCPILYSVEMMLGESRAKDWSIERYILLHEAWVGEIVHELGL